MAITRTYKAFCEAQGIKPGRTSSQRAWDEYVKNVLVPVWEEEDSRSWRPIMDILKADAAASGRTVEQVLEDDGILKGGK
jgi:hypothetical protein